jgi:hypothetical protein
VDGGDHHRGVQLLAAGQGHPGGPAAGDQHPLDPGAGTHRRPELQGRALDGVRDRPHAALGEAPAAQVAVADVADRVVGHDVGGAGRLRPGPGADHPVDGQAGLDLLGLEPVVEQVADAHGHEPGHVADGAHVKALVAPGQPEQLAQVRGPAGAELGRGLGEQRPKDGGQALQPGVPAGHGVGVSLGESRDLLVVAAGVVVDGQRAAVRPDLVGRAHREQLGAVPLQVVDDPGRHEAHHVRQPGHLDLGGLGPGGVGGGRAPVLDLASMPPPVPD